MGEASDLELVRLLRAPEMAVRERAFTALFERHAQRAQSLAFRVLGDAGLAADAVQDVFLSLYTKGARFEERAQFTSWLYRVVLNRSIDLRRRERRHPPGRPDAAGRRSSVGEESTDPLRTVASPGRGPEGAALDAERAAIVRAAIDRLSPKLAQIVVLRYPEGLSYEEIEEILRLPPGTVKSRLNRAHEALRELLEEWLDDT